MDHLRIFKRSKGSKVIINVAFSVIVALGWAMGFKNSVWADAAPPAQPPGSNIEPGSGTMVQMVAENVLLWIGLGNDVSVSADFAMRNQGTPEEILAVRFPMENPNGWGDGYGNHSQVRDFSVRVNDTQVPFKIVEESYTEQDDPIPWATFEVEFPPGEDVIISVKYSTELYGYNHASLDYVLGTGAGWYGPIGSAAITLRLPYAVSPTNVDFVHAGGSDTGITFVGNEVRWQAQNYEPSPYSVYGAGIIWPSYWKEILDLEARIGKNQGDLEAVLALAEAYRYIDPVKGYVADEDLFSLSENTVLQALALHPSDPDLYAELAVNRWWRLRNEGVDIHIHQPEVQNVLRVLMIALKGNPDNQVALQLLDEMRGWLGDFELPEEIPAIDLPPYTPTPEATERILPISTPQDEEQEEDIKELFLFTPTPHPTATIIAPTSTFSPEPTSPAGLVSPEPEGSNALGFIVVGLASLMAGALIGYIVAKR
jgi:hypothetical protein